MTAQNYRNLQAWQKAMDLVVAVYRCTEQLPQTERFGLISQMRRAAVSVPSNIAEGKGRFSNKELVQFLLRARGSLLELDTQVMLAYRLGYVSEIQFSGLQRQCAEVGKILNGLINHFATATRPLASSAET
ncbi:MAG TPA: four helix bundle protein [Terriglobales bacterium]